MPKQTRIVTTASGDYEVDVDVPTASVPDDTFSKGFHEGLKKEPVAGGLVGFGEAFPAGLAKGAWDTIKFPLTAIKGIVGGTAALATDPVGTLTSLRDSIADLPAHAKKAFDDAIELASTDPEGWGKAVGTVTGGIEGGIATSRIPLKPGIRVAGKAMQYAGEHPFVARMSGGAMVGRGMIKGDPLTIGAGVATMGVPALLTKTGKALREFSGEDLSTALPSGARTLDVDASQLKGGIRVQPPQGAGSAPVPYVAPEEVPYRPAARAAQKTDDLATKAANLKARTAGMESSGARITTSESGVSPTGERVTSSQTFKPGGAGGASGEQPIMVGGRMIDPNNPDTRALYDLTVKAQANSAPGVRLSGSARRGTPLQTAMQDATEAEVNANAAVRGTPGDVPATPAAQRLEAERKAAAKGVRTSPPAKPVPSEGSGVASGASDEDIIALRTAHGAEEAGTKLASDPRFAGMSKTERTNAIRDIAGDEAGLAPTSMQKDIDTKLKGMSAEDARAYRAKAPNAVAYKYITSRMKDLGLDAEE